MMLQFFWGHAGYCFTSFVPCPCFIPRSSFAINSCNGIVITISNNITSGYGRIRDSKLVGTNKPSNPGIVIPRLKVVKPCILVIDVSPIAQRVQAANGTGQGAGAGEGIAPGVVGVFNDDLAGIVGDGRDVALGVVEKEVLGAVEANGHGLAIGVAADGHTVGTVKDVDKLTLGISIAGDYIVKGLRRFSKFAVGISIFDAEGVSSCQNISIKEKSAP